MIRINGENRTSLLNGNFEPFIIVVVFLLLSGCTFKVPLKPTVDQPSNSYQLPLIVGIYYGNEFRSYEYVEIFGRKKGTHDKYVYPLGQASMNLFDQVFSLMFINSVAVSNRHGPDIGEQKLDAMIEPKIEEFEVGVPSPIWEGPFWAEINYRFLLYSPKGDLVASWTVTGEGEKQGQFGRLINSRSEAVDLAMRDAAMKFTAGFQNIPEVRNWLRQIGVLGAKQES